MAFWGSLKHKQISSVACQVSAGAALCVFGLFELLVGHLDLLSALLCALLVGELHASPNSSNQRRIGYMEGYRTLSQLILSQEYHSRSYIS